MSITINSGKEQDDVIRDLRNVSKEKSKPIIPFIGAGASYILGLPSWEVLVQGYATKVGFVGDLKVLFLKYDRSWPKVTEDIFTFSVSNSCPDQALTVYKEYMASMSPTNAHYHSLHITLLQNFKRIVTTNYDRAFERAHSQVIRGPALKPLYFPYSLLPITFLDGTIAYMHGHTVSGTYVFRQAEYDYAYNGRIITDFLSSVVQTSYLLFIGFSFDDAIFRTALEKVISEWKKDLQERERTYGVQPVEQPKLYVFLSTKDLENTISQAEIAKYGIATELVQKYFNLDQYNAYEIIHNSGIETEPFFIGDFKLEYSRIKFNIKRVEYLEDLNFEIFEYANKNYTQIENIVTQICQPEVNFSEDFPNISNTGQ